MFKSFFTASRNFPKVNLSQFGNRGFQFLFCNSKKTYILAITKKNKVSEKQTDPVFTYLVSEIGESRDINRFRISQDDLSEAVELFQSFNGNKKNFHKFQEIKPDKRCKL